MGELKTEMEATFAAKSATYEQNQKVSLLQMRSSKRRVAMRQAAADFLQRRARALDSKSLLSLAAAVEASPFAKVITMVKDLIKKLKEEASAEAAHKQWCDKE